MIFRTFCSILFIIIGIKNPLLAKSSEVNEWKDIELLAEKHPYIVALLNKTRDYVCTGTTISRRTVLTSGYCTAPKPAYVVVGMALINKNSLINLVKVTDIQLHADYTFTMKSTEHIVAQMHSNIGLVFVEKPVLDLFVPPATVGSYYAEELIDTELMTVGYGERINGNIIVLQYQGYDQTPCMNPRWYYCICGTEIQSSTHGNNFGNGAPTLYGKNVVGVVAYVRKTSTFESANEKFNIFTVIAPYIPWIEKTEASITRPAVAMRAIENKAALNYDLKLVPLCLYSWLLY